LKRAVHFSRRSSQSRHTIRTQCIARDPRVTETRRLRDFI